MNSIAESVSCSQRIKCQHRPHLNRPTKIAAWYFLNVTRSVGIVVIVFGIKRAFHSHTSTGCYAIYWAFGMHIFNCIFIACSTTSSASPSQFSVSRLPLSTSSIPHLETWFGRLILKGVDFSAELFVRAICQNKPLTPLLKSPLIHLPKSLSLKVLFPSSRPFPLTLTSGFVKNQLCDYSNEVINYWLFLPPYHRLVCL